MRRIDGSPNSSETPRPAPVVDQPEREIHSEETAREEELEQARKMATEALRLHHGTLRDNATLANYVEMNSVLLLEILAVLKQYPEAFAAILPALQKWSRSIQEVSDGK